MLVFSSGNVCGVMCYRKHLGFKRIMLFTNNDNPHPDDPQRVRLVNLLVTVSADV